MPECIFIHSFVEHKFWSFGYAPCSILGSEDTTMNQIDTILTLAQFT